MLPWRRMLAFSSHSLSRTLVQGGARSLRPSVYTQASRSTGNAVHSNPPKPTAEEIEKEKEKLRVEEIKHFGPHNEHPKKLSHKELEDIAKAPPPLLMAYNVNSPNKLTFPCYLRIPHPKPGGLGFYIHGDFIVDTGAPGSGIVFPVDDPVLERAKVDWIDIGKSFASIDPIDVEIHGRVYQNVYILKHKRWKHADGHFPVIGLPLLNRMVVAIIGNQVTDDDLKKVPALLHAKGKGKYIDLLGTPPPDRKPTSLPGKKGTSLPGKKGTSLPDKKGTSSPDKKGTPKPTTIREFWENNSYVRSDKYTNK